MDTIYYFHIIGLCGDNTVVILTVHAGICSHVICIMTQTPCLCRQPRVHDSEWTTRQPPISPLHPKGLCEGQVAVLSCPAHLWPNTVSCVPREEKAVQDINIASFRCSSAQGNGRSKCVTWIYKLCFIFFLMILNTKFWVLLIICVLWKPLQTGNCLCFLHRAKEKSWLYYAPSPLFKSMPI